jgi:hypothetical protein
MTLWFVACNPDPGINAEIVGYRDGSAESEGFSAERGTVKISEIGWAGSVTTAGAFDPADSFVELRNEGARPVDVGGWLLVVSGVDPHTVVLPSLDALLQPGDHAFFARTVAGCFPDPDGVLADLRLPVGGDPFAITLRDRDERLVETVGHSEEPPFAGGYDGTVTRSMERAELMFGADGGLASSWHFYTTVPVEIPNDDRVAFPCRGRTLASPGRPNSPDYGGSYSSGSLE